MPSPSDWPLEAADIYGWLARTPNRRAGGSGGMYRRRKCVGGDETERKEALMAKQHIENKQQTFSITAPDAMRVLLVGDFTHWQEQPIPMKKEAGGVWRAIVALSPGTHHYRFIVDGEWCDNPDCTLRVPNPYGSHDAVRQVT